MMKRIARAPQEYYFIVLENGGYRGRNSLFVPTDTSHWEMFYQYATSPELIFDSDIEVLNVYCLDGEPSHNGMYIYYVTNAGDYVLYKEYATAEKMYMVPRDEFCEYAEIEWERRGLAGTRDEMGSGASSVDVHLKPYLYKEGELVTKPTSTHIFIGAGVLLVLLAFVCVVRIRQNKTE